MISPLGGIDTVTPNARVILPVEEIIAAGENARLLVDL
jgi:hypothetical protein